MRTALQVGGGFTAVGIVAWIGFLLSFRFKLRPVLDAVRRLNRTVINPRQLHTAGRPGARASLVRHVGRSTGTPYGTPVVAVPTDDGFVIALPYGPSADWVRNVVAAGSAVVEHEGRSVPVERPEVVATAAVASSFPAGERRTQRLFGVDDVLLLRHAVQPSATVR